MGIPGGYMDVHETAEEAATRETLEEANLRVDGLSLLGVYTRPGPGVVVVVFEALALGEASIGEEVSEIAWFHPRDIPWEELAFDTTQWALRDWARRRGLPAPD
ncbi:MAG: NUDIX domain-containing protein [Dehalococcoidia bacterium]|nr:NUDIX domain-containing protein [Dehalococcoidia bacterium]